MAILETRNEKVPIDIGHEPLDGTRLKVVDAARELWEWMAEKGYDNVKLEDVVELAEKMVGKKDGGSGGGGLSV
jgi:hypothetical protein